MPEEMSANSEGEDLFRTVEETLKQLRAAATPPPAPPESWLKKTFNPAPSSSHQSEFNVALVDTLIQMASALRERAASQEVRLQQIAKELLELRAFSETLDAFRENSVRADAELRTVAANVRGLQERSAALETELAQAREELGEKFEQLSSKERDRARELGERIEQLSQAERALARELGERIQQLAAEQHQLGRDLGEGIPQLSGAQEGLRRELGERIQQLSGAQEGLRRELGERIQHLLDEQRVCIRQLSLQASEEAVLADRARRATELKLEELARRVPPPPA